GRAGARVARAMGRLQARGHRHTLAGPGRPPGRAGGRRPRGTSLDRAARVDGPTIGKRTRTYFVVPGPKRKRGNPGPMNTVQSDDPVFIGSGFAAGGGAPE